jgi:hypothetical protein
MPVIEFERSWIEKFFSREIFGKEKTPRPNLAIQPLRT